MKVIKAYPPNFMELAKRFPIKGKQGILYAWGDTLYNPSGVKVTPWIMAHEEVHGERQKVSNLAAWWHNYMTKPGYRLYEELLAHQEEWKTYRYKMGGDEHYLEAISKRLSSPLYGSLISYAAAYEAIQAQDYLPDEVSKVILGNRACDNTEGCS